MIIGSASFGLLALCLLAGAVSGNHNGSSGGTIGLVGFGFVLLLVSVLAFAGGVTYLKSSKPSSKNVID